MLDVLVPIVLASVTSSGIMWLLDVVDKPSGQKKAAHGVEPVHGTKRKRFRRQLEYTTCAHKAQGGNCGKQN